MTISILIQGRSAYLSADLQRVLGPNRSTGPFVVARTNVPHSDDPEMMLRLEHRRSEYQKAFGLDIQEVNASHQADQTLLNLSGGVLLLDSFNLHISNTWLRNNSRPYEETASLLRREATDIGESLRLLEETGSFSRILVLTSEVQTDYNVSSPDLAQYAEYIAEANASLIAHLIRSGISPEIYFAGTILPRLTLFKES